MIVTRFEDEDKIERVVAANGMTSKEHKLFFAQITVGTKGRVRAPSYLAMIPSKHSIVMI